MERGGQRYQNRTALQRLPLTLHPRSEEHATSHPDNKHPGRISYRYMSSGRGGKGCEGRECSGLGRRGVWDDPQEHGTSDNYLSTTLHHRQERDTTTKYSLSRCYTPSRPLASQKGSIKRVQTPATRDAGHSGLWGSERLGSSVGCGVGTERAPSSLAHAVPCQRAHSG